MQMIIMNCSLIKESTYEFSSPYWDNVSEQAKDLIRKLLIVDPKQRLSCDEILKHPWLTQTSHSGQVLPFKEDYIEYKKKSKMKAAIMATMIVKLWKKITFNKK